MTRRRQRFNPPATPVLTVHFSADPKAFEDMNMDEHGFREDVANGVTPYFMYRDRPKLTAEIDGDAAQATLILKDLGNDSAYDATEQLCDAISEVASVVSWSGRGVFEICQDETGATRLVTIPDKGLWVFPFYCVQAIPKRDRERLKRHFNIVRTSKLWIVNMPRSLGGHWGFRAILRQLRSASNMGPMFFRRDIATYLGGSVYSFKDYTHALNVYQEVVTRVWNWDRRDASGEEATDMYYMFKKFAFRAAQCTLRDHILDEINRLFVILKVPAEARLKDAPTSADFLAARERFMTGDMQLKEALKFCRRSE